MSKAFDVYVFRRPSRGQTPTEMTVSWWRSKRARGCDRADVFVLASQLSNDALIVISHRSTRKVQQGQAS